MTKVSRIPLRKDIWDKIFDIFIQSVVDIKDKKELTAFVNDFFSPTERIMFAKRLSAAVMLSKGQSYADVRYKLKLSPPTIAKMSEKVSYAGGGLNPVIARIYKRQMKEILTNEFLDLLDFKGKGKSWSGVSNRHVYRKTRINEIKSGV